MKRLLFIGMLFTHALQGAATKHADFLCNLQPGEQDYAGPAVTFHNPEDRMLFNEYIQWLSTFDSTHQVIPSKYLSLYERIVIEHPSITFRSEKARATYVHSLGHLIDAHEKARLEYEAQQQWERVKEDLWIKHRHTYEEDTPQIFSCEAAERYEAALKDPAFRAAQKAAKKEFKTFQQKKNTPVIATPATVAPALHQAPAPLVPVVVQTVPPVVPALTALQLAKAERDAAEKVLADAIAERDALYHRIEEQKKTVNPKTEALRNALAEARKEAELNKQAYVKQCQEAYDKAVALRDQAYDTYWNLAEKTIKKNAPHVNTTEAKKDWNAFMEADKVEGMGARLVRYFKVGISGAAITGSILCILEIGRQIRSGNATTITEALKIVLHSQFKNIKIDAIFTGALCTGNQVLRDAFCGMWSWCFGADETSEKESLLGQADRYITAGIAAPILAGAAVFCLNLWFRFVGNFGSTLYEVSTEGISRIQLCLTGSFGEMLSDLFKPSEK